MYPQISIHHVVKLLQTTTINPPLIPYWLKKYGTTTAMNIWSWMQAKQYTMLLINRCSEIQVPIQRAMYSDSKTKRTAYVQVVSVHKKICTILLPANIYINNTAHVTLERTYLFFPI